MSELLLGRRRDTVSAKKEDPLERLLRITQANPSSSFARRLTISLNKELKEMWDSEGFIGANLREDQFLKVEDIFLAQIKELNVEDLAHTWRESVIASKSGHSYSVECVRVAKEVFEPVGHTEKMIARLRDQKLFLRALVEESTRREFQGVQFGEWIPAASERLHLEPPLAPHHVWDAFSSLTHSKRFSLTCNDPAEVRRQLHSFLEDLITEILTKELLDRSEDAEDALLYLFRKEGIDALCPLTQERLSEVVNLVVRGKTLTQALTRTSSHRNSQLQW